MSGARVTKWRLTFAQWARGRRGYEPIYHIVADEFRAIGLCGVDLAVVATEIEAEGIPARMCKRCLLMRSRSRANAARDAVRCDSTAP